MIPPTRFDIFPPDWGILRRSRRVQIFLEKIVLKQFCLTCFSLFLFLHIMSCTLVVRFSRQPRSRRQSLQSERSYTDASLVGVPALSLPPQAADVRDDLPPVLPVETPQSVNLEDFNFNPPTPQVLYHKQYLKLPGINIYNKTLYNLVLVLRYAQGIYW